MSNIYSENKTIVFYSKYCMTAKLGTGNKLMEQMPHLYISITVTTCHLDWTKNVLSNCNKDFKKKEFL